MDFFLGLYKHGIVAFIKRHGLINIILGAIDILAITLAFQIAFLTNTAYRSSEGFFFFSNKDLLKLFIYILPLWLVVLYLMQVTEIPRTKRYRTLLYEYIVSAFVVSGLILIFYFLFSGFNISRRFLVEFVFLGFIFLFAARYGEYKIFRTYRAKGFNYINIALIGDETSVPFIARITSTPVWGYKIKSIFTDSGQINESLRGKYEILPTRSPEIIEKMMTDDVIDEVLYIKKKINPPEVRRILRSCEEFGITFRLLTRENQPGLTNAYISELAYEKFLTFSNIPHKPLSLGIKKFIDVFFSLFLLILFLPLIIIISLLIAITSRGPVIYSQERIGLRGRPFLMYKFRTMIAGADEMKESLKPLNEMDGPAFKIKNDPRVTRIGRILRRTGFDELPQLFNVIKGEMSLIGPRPPLKEETAGYRNWQLRRLSVKPGLSCFWQVKPERNSIKFEKWMEMDLAYIDNWSLRLDFLILIKTIRTVFQRSGL